MLFLFLCVWMKNLDGQENNQDLIFIVVSVNLPSGSDV